MFKRALLALGLALAFTGTVTGQPAAAPFTIVETGAVYATLADAVAAIGEGRGTIRIAPGRYRECAVQEAGEITYAAATPGSVTFDAVMCEGKAALVLRGRSARVQGIIFTNMRVPDGNGAGIRIEQGDLHVSEVLFIDGQCGILSATDPDGHITIDHSTFSGLGRHPDGNGAHALYIGHYGSLTVTNSRFERGTGGHYLKSRTPRVTILNSSFDDSQGRDTNYMIDLPNGAAGRIAGNTFVQGNGKENYSTLIAIAAEEREFPSTNLIIEDNTASLVPGFRWTTAFVGNWSGAAVIMRNNRLAAGITPHAAR